MRVRAFFLVALLLASVAALFPVASAQTFPSILATNSSNDTGNTHIVDLPEGIEDGDLLLIVWMSAVTDVFESHGVETPTGWTKLFDETMQIGGTWCAAPQIGRAHV